MKRLPLYLCTGLLGAALLTLIGCAGTNYASQAESFLEEGNYDQALAYADSALMREEASASEKANAYMLKARVYQQQVDSTTPPMQRMELIRQAADAQNQAIEADPGMRSQVESQRRLAYIQQMQSGAADFRRARQTQDSTVFVNAASHFDAASSFGPDSAAAFQNKAYALINAGRQNDAIAPLEQYIQKSDSVSTDGYAILAQLYLTNDRGDDAINLLQEAVQTYPADNELQSLLLTAFQQAGRPDDAMNQVARQVEQNPDNPTYRYNYGSLLLRADRFDEAIEQLSQAIELQGSPETASDSADAARAHYNLGAAHVNKAAGLIDSIRTIQDTLRNDRQNLADQQVQEFQERAQQLDEQRRTLFSDAIAPLEEARALNPAGANQGVQEQSLCSALFRAYAQTEQVEKAEEVQECAGLSDDALEQDEESSSQQQP